MKTRALSFMTVMALIAFCPGRNGAQKVSPSPDLPRYEVGVDFTTFSQANDTHAGVGGRFTYNLNRHFALETAGYFSPGCTFCAEGLTGNITEVLAGVKAGQRFKRFGIFGKVRPGFINLSKAAYDLVPTGSSTFSISTGEVPFRFVTHNRTDFATDVGGVLEIYPKKKLLLRFDGGLIIERVGSQTFHGASFDSATGLFTPLTTTFPAHTQGRFQFIGGVGFRF